MNIVAPLSRLEELDLLLNAGADELYCSVAPDEWRAAGGSGATSRRMFANLAAEEHLLRALEQCLAQSRRLSLVLNAQHYTEAQMDSLLPLARRYAAHGGTALIVADVMLLELLASEVPGVALHLSSVAACRSVHSARFFERLGASRVIFPRDMTLAEMQRIATTVPSLSFEAFVLNDGCVFEESLCHSIHLPAKLGGAICMDRYNYRYHRADGEPVSATEQAAFTGNDERYQHWLWRRFSNGFSVTENGYPYGPCGLCAIPALQRASVDAIKIAGRDAPTERKQRSIELVRWVRDRWLAKSDESALIDYAQGARGDRHRCYDSRWCYYPDQLRRHAHSSPTVFARG